MARSASLSAYGMLCSAIFVVALAARVFHAAAGRVERRVLRAYASEQLA